MRHSILYHPRLLPLLALCLTLPAGCTLLTTSQLPFAKKKPEYQVPRQMVPVWSDTVLHQPGSAATRGFGGRLMFYGQDKHKPIRVQGSLVVYAWDDSKGSMERTPDRKFVFPSENLQTHYSESQLGHSYSFWVPWDAAGGSLQRLTLISRFLSIEGTELTATPAHVVLQGPSDSSPFPNEISDAGSVREKPADHIGVAAHGRKRKVGGIQQVGYELKEDETHLMNGRSYSRPAHPGLQSSEIGLTSGFYERNMQGSQADRASTEFTATDADDLLAPAPVNETQVFDSGNHDRAPSSSTLDHADDAEQVEEPDQRSTGFPPFESRVRTSRTTRSFDAHARKAPLRARWPSGRPETPRSLPSETE